MKAITIILEDDESILIRGELRKMIPGPSSALLRYLIKAENNKEFTKKEIKELLKKMEDVDWDYPVLYELKTMLNLIINDYEEKKT